MWHHVWVRVWSQGHLIFDHFHSVPVEWDAEYFDGQLKYEAVEYKIKQLSAKFETQAQSDECAILLAETFKSNPMRQAWLYAPPQPEPDYSYKPTEPNYNSAYGS